MSVRRNETPATGAFRPDRLVAQIACRQEAVIATAQLRSAGLTPKQIEHRVVAGHLHPWHRGVYGVGHPPLTHRALLWAALLAVGEDAVVDGEAAIRLHGFWPADDDPPLEIEVAVPRRVRHRHGVRVRRVERLQPRDWTRRSGIRVLTPELALLGLSARGAGPELLRAALRRGYVERRTNVGRMRAVLAQHPGHPGVARLRRFVEEGFVPTRSELENVMVDFLRARGIGGWLVNAPVALRDGRRVEADFVFPDLRVVLETDGARFHGDPLSRADDRARQSALERDGWIVVRVTWRQLARRRAETERRIRRTLEGVEVRV